MSYFLVFLTSLSDMKSTIFFLVTFGAVLSEMFQIPSNTAVMAGEAMNMNCVTTNQSQVRKWTFYSISRVFSTIYRHGQTGGLQEHFTHFGVEINTNGPVIISANSTRSSDAGIYSCHCKIDRKDAEYSAQLIVLESLPVCENNFTKKYSHGLIDDDHIWIQCSINFKGFWEPSMEWTQHGEYFGPEGKRVTDGIETQHTPSHSVTSKLTITVNSAAIGSYYSCRIYFARYSGTEVTTAKNVPRFTYTWNSSVLFMNAWHFLTYNDNTAYDTDQSASYTEQSASVTSSTTEKPFSVDWYLVSLSLVAAFSVFFLVMVVRAIVRCIRVKKAISDHYASATKETIEMPMQESAYDIIPYATSDNYETIGEEDIDPSIVIPSRPRLGTLPTPGYAGLMPVQPSAPAVYSRMENYATPEDIAPDSTLTKVVATIENLQEKQLDELGPVKTESPLKESLHVPTYLEVRE